MERSIPVLLVVLALVLAGCNGFAFGGGNVDSSRGTVTPAAVPTDRPTATPVPQLAPGLTGNGVSDAVALGNAHAAVLGNTSYTLVENSSVRYRNGTAYYRSNTTVELASNGSRYYGMNQWTGVQINGSTFHRSAWSNGTQVFTAQGFDDDISYEGSPGLSERAASLRKNGFRPTNHQRLSTLFSSVETRVTGREQRNGTRLYRVAATEVTSTLPFERRRQNPRNVTFRALIGPRGLVYEYRVEYTATQNNDPVRVRRHVRYTRLGNTTIERPPWYDDAIANVSTTASTGTSMATSTAS